MPRRRRLLGTLLALSTAGCQAVFGDFEIVADAPAATALGTECEPNVSRCDGARLETCAADRRGFALVTTCASAAECDASAAACRRCVPGEWACNGTVLQSCSAERTWQWAADCETSELCKVGGDRLSGSCVSPVCDAGSFACDGNRLLACSEGRDGLELVEQCASGPLCDPERARRATLAGDHPTCVTPLCLPGTFACDGATLMRCSWDQNAWETLFECPNAASCNPQEGTCAQGQAGTFACSGAELVRAGPEGFALSDTCASPVLCDASNGRCQRRECGKLGARRCGGDLPSVEECLDGGSWAVREVCDTHPLCAGDAGRCLAPACEFGTTRCLANQHQVCSADLTRWVTDETCGPNEVCGAEGCEPAACTEGAFRCVEAGLEVCSDGRFQPKLKCLTAALCRASEGRCGDPQCGGPQNVFQCREQTPWKCAPGREAWVRLDARACTTPPALVCDDDAELRMPTPDCDVCRPLEYACRDNELTRCSADGQSAPTVASCPGGCTLPSGVPTCL